MKILKCLLMIVTAPVILVLTLFVCILVFCLSVPDNMSRMRSVAKE